MQLTNHSICLEADLQEGMRKAAIQASALAGFRPDSAISEAVWAACAHAAAEIEMAGSRVLRAVEAGLCSDRGSRSAGAPGDAP